MDLHTTQMDDLAWYRCSMRLPQVFTIPVVVVFTLHTLHG